MKKNLRYLFAALFCISFIGVNVSMAQDQGRPRIIVKESDKAAIQKKIKDYPWAKAIYDRMESGVREYVERHKKDPEWILSRYLMNWTEGKHYTDFYGRGQSYTIDSMKGNAPYPTVRISVLGRHPVNEQGNSYKNPSIEDMIPYDTSMFMMLIDPDTKQKVKAEPRGIVEELNGRINNLAFNAALVYWLTGKQEYAKFAADILNQWARGAWYQNPIHGARTYGFIGLQTLNDANLQSLILAYDFLQPYMKKNGYELKYYEPVWTKLAETILVNGYMSNNWFAAESTTLVYSSLSLDNKKTRDYYMNFFLEKDTINGGMGHLGMRSAVKEWLTWDGHWKEPGGYHPYPVSNLLLGALAAENNGYKVFDKYPALFNAASVALKYAYPNLYISSFGDSGRSIPDGTLIETALIFAQKSNPEAVPQLLASLDMLVKNGAYSRSKAGFMGLLTYNGDISNPKGYKYEWKRSGSLEFAEFYAQRNGTDRKSGLMYTVQAATYNHNHVNGMGMELYGAGEVMGLDPGNGPYYEHPSHIYYFAQWACHNNVVAGGRSSSVPFSGAASAKNIGKLTLQAMEPQAEADAVSPYCSFTDTRFLDKSTNTNQQRTMALIRTGEKSGYYVDIFRSDNPQRNDYMYHNIGNKVEYFTPSGTAMNPVADKIALVEKDYPGFRFIEDVQSVKNAEQGVVAKFSLLKESPKSESFMNAYIAGGKNRTYYMGYSPKSKTAGKYSDLKVPTIDVQTAGEAWNSPFVVVYEPYIGADKNTVEAIEVLNATADHVLMKVNNKNGTSQLIYQGTDSKKRFEDKSGRTKFEGYFAVVSLRGNSPEHIYIGRGKELTFAGYTVKGIDENCAFSADIENNTAVVSANQPVEIILSDDFNGATLNGESLKIKRAEGSNGITIPACKNAKLVIE